MTPSNYRGITVGSNLSKLFAKILNIRLENFMKKRNIICRDFIKGRHPAICRRFKRVKSPVRMLETNIFFH
jgi:hypothetical protein